MRMTRDFGGGQRRSAGGSRRATILAATALLGAFGCVFPEDFEDRLEYFEPVSSEGVSRLSPLLVGRNTAADPARLGSISGDIAEAVYSVEPRRRPFLLSGDIAEGIEGGNYLHLPQEADGEIRHVQRIDNPSLWHSFRVYDAGICSAYLPWLVFAPELFDGLAESFDASTAVRGGSLVRGSMGPVLQMAPRAGTRDLGTDTDRIRLSFTLHASELALGKNSGFFGIVADVLGVRCDDVTFDVWSLELSVVPAARAELSFPPVTADQNIPEEFLDECPPSSPGGTLVLGPDAPARDLLAVVHELDVEVSGCGLANDQVADAFARILTRAVSTFVGRGLRDLLLVAPEDLGVEAVPCACDQQCNAFAAGGPPYPGLRHRCVASQTSPEVRGVCHVQLEPSRLNVYPDGLGLVVIDSFEDSQAGLLATDWDEDGRPGGGDEDVPFSGEWLCDTSPRAGRVDCDDEACRPRLGFIRTPARTRREP